MSLERDITAIKTLVERGIFKAATPEQIASRPKPVIKPGQVIYINGYYKDDPQHPFERYKCKIDTTYAENEPVEDDMSIFYYFDSIEQVEDIIAHPEHGTDFVITGYTI